MKYAPDVGVTDVPEGAEGLLVMQVCWADGGKHGCLGVAPQTLLQEPGEGGVTVRNVHLLTPARGVV